MVAAARARNEEACRIRRQRFALNVRCVHGWIDRYALLFSVKTTGADSTVYSYPSLNSAWHIDMHVTLFFHLTCSLDHKWAKDSAISSQT